MKSISKAFHDGLRRSNLRLCRCWRIELEDGAVFRFTEHDVAVTVDGEEYLPTNGFSSSAFSAKADFSVDNINVVALTSDDITETDLSAGRFDNAKVKIFYVQWDQPSIGTMPLMGARLGEMTLKDGEFETELRSVGQALQQKTGRTYGLECDADLGDKRCKVNLADWTSTGVITALFDNVTFGDSTRTEANDYYQYGMLKFTTGQNQGLEVEVRGYKTLNHMIVLLEPPAYPMAVGDEYEIVAGCDKTCDTCKLKFQQHRELPRLPHMPTEQEATETPNAKSEE